MTSSTSSVLAPLALLLAAACGGSAPLRTPIPSDTEVATSLEAIGRDAKRQDNAGPTLQGGGPRFVDRTADYGLAGVEGVSFALVDLNRDLIPDLVLMPGYYSQPRAFLFDLAEKRFVEHKGPLFSEIVQASFLVFADFNNDRVLDVVVGTLNQRGEYSKQPLTLWQGHYDQGGVLRFEKASGFPALPAAPTSAVVVIDANLDGRLDLFVGNWFQEIKKNLLPHPDWLLLNRPKEWQVASEFLRGEDLKTGNDLYPPAAKPTYGASSCDVDQDGWPDILTASSAGHYNKLWMSRPSFTGERDFIDVGKESGYAADPNGLLVATNGGRTFTAVCSDYNDDGLMDVFLGELTHGWDNLSADRSSVLTGAKVGYPPSFLRTEYMAESVADNWNQGDKRGVWADLNNDGLVDILVDNSGFPPNSRLVAFAQDETRAFSNVAHQWGIDVVNPTGTVVADFNGDGKLDILTGQSNIRKESISNRIYLFENQLDLRDRRSFVFHLEGERANHQGIGATVMLYTEKTDGDKVRRVVQRRWYELAQGGIPSQLAPGIHFGVDAGVRVVGVKVRWPVRARSLTREHQTLERLYKISDDGKKGHAVFTLCEDGQLLAERFSCAL